MDKEGEAYRKKHMVITLSKRKNFFTFINFMTCLVWYAEVKSTIFSRCS